MTEEKELNEFKTTTKETTDDDFKIKGKIVPKVDLKHFIKDGEILFKSVDASLSVHKEWDEDEVTLDASIKVNLADLDNGTKAIKKGSFLVTKKF